MQLNWVVKLQLNSIPLQRLQIIFLYIEQRKNWAKWNVDRKLRGKQNMQTKSYICVYYVCVGGGEGYEMN